MMALPSVIALTEWRIGVAGETTARNDV